MLSQMPHHAVVFQQPFEIGDVVFHRVVVRAKEIHVAVKLVLLPRDEDERAAPLRRIAESIARVTGLFAFAKDGVLRRGRRLNQGTHQLSSALRPSISAQTSLRCGA